MDGMSTLRTLRRSAQARLRAAGVDSPELDARLLIQHALGFSRDQLLTRADMVLTPEQVAAVDALVARRVAREPVSRILGSREFWSLDFQLGPATLDPRPDTETLVEAALRAVAVRRGAPLAVLDLGTGTGCILLALLTELPAATGLGLDISLDAVAVAEGNAARLGLAPRARFQIGDWNQGLAGQLGGRRFDLIVSNPPYIVDGEIATLEPEVACHDPWAALAGGVDGLDAYRSLAPQMAALLNPGGVVVFEVGAGQAADVTGLLRAVGLPRIATACDLGGMERCVIAHTNGWNYEDGEKKWLD